jgi:hypothetical protein
VTTPPPYGSPSDPYGQQQPGQYPPGQYPQDPYGQQPPGYGPPTGGYGAPQGYDPQQQQPGWGQPPGYGPGPGGFGGPPPYGTPIPNYLWQSIVVTLACCLPAGVVAIVYSTRVQNLQQMGDIQGAMAASRNAKKWCIISLSAAAVVLVLYVLAIVALGVSLSGSSSSNY